MDFRWFREEEVHRNALMTFNGLATGKSHIMELEYHDWKPRRTKEDIDQIKVDLSNTSCSKTKLYNAVHYRTSFTSENNGRTQSHE
jgi:hypothetical protein